MKVEELWPLVKRHLWWIAPLLVVVANMVVLSTYRSLYSGRVDVLSEAIEAETGLLDRLSEQQADISTLVERSIAADEGIDLLYSQHFATESERLTALITEVRELASRAGAVPDRINYPEEFFEDYGLIERSMVFTVDGTYEELRLFVNYLEQSGSFLVLESLGLQDGSEGKLRIRTILSTLFSGRDQVVDLEGSEDPDDLPGAGA